MLVLEGAKHLLGPDHHRGGTLQFGNGTSGSTDGSLAATCTDNAALVYNLAGSQTYSGAISGSGGLTKIGAGALTLAGSNSYSGGTTSWAGTLAVASTAALPGYSTASKVTVSSSGTLTLSVGGRSWAATDVSSLFPNSGGFASGSALGIDTTEAAGGFSYSTAITGSMGLTKFGPNTLTLSGQQQLYWRHAGQRRRARRHQHRRPARLQHAPPRSRSTTAQR